MKVIKKIMYIFILNIFALVLFASGYYFFIRPWHRTWGATDAEIVNQMPGDNLIKKTDYRTTRAITIDALPEKIWPWLVQMGYQRGGLYSYDWLDRIQGILDRPSLNKILPEFQDLKPGDHIPIVGTQGWPVFSIEENRSLVLDIRQPPVHITWSWLLKSVDSQSTRLILRIKGLFLKKSVPIILFAFLDPAEFSMVRKMLTGIKNRVEGKFSTPGDEFIELIMWCFALMVGMIAFIGAFFRKKWISLFCVSWSSWLLFFFLALGQPHIIVSIFFNIILVFFLIWALRLRKQLFRSE